MADIKKILKNMTIDEKIGQLMISNANLFIDTAADITGPMTELGLTEEQVTNIGSVLNYKTVDEVRKIQESHLEKDRNKIPMLFMMDVIHGYRTIYPIPLALGCSFDPEIVKKCSRVAAEESCQGGTHLTYTPMVDYVRDARWGRVMESCGEDPLLNCTMGAAQVEGFQGKSLKENGTIATCVKHFAAYGGAEAGRDYNQVELSEHILREFYFPAYKACIDAGTTMVMPSFNVLNGVPSTANPWLMQDILRKEWGFDGVVISDYNAVEELKRHGIAAEEKERARLCFINECDIEMVSNTYAHCLKELINDGAVTEEQLDKSVLRVLKLKDDLGLFDDPYRGAAKTESETVYMTEEYRNIVRLAAEECAVLLKNDGILPLDKGIKKIALIGPYADNGDFNGSWSCYGNIEENITVKNAIECLLPDAEVKVASGCKNLWNDTDRSGFDEAVKIAQWADAVILCLGEPSNYSGEGNSRVDIILPGIQDDLAEAVKNANSNTVAVTFSGRPLNLTRLDRNAKAILHMWFPGTEGGNAVANLLFGNANPCGKLSMSFPKHVGQCPIYYNHANTGRPKYRPENEFAPYSSNYIDCGNLPLYSFGHGLSYSNFVYEDMELSADKMTFDGSINVKITVYNDSKVAGKEVVALYMQDLFASNARPIQQLIAFNKVEFKPFERKTIEFTVNEPMLRFWNNENKHVSEKGDFRLFTGYADHCEIEKNFELI